MEDRHFNELSAEESRVIDDKGTEAPFTGRFTDAEAAGIYVCRKCNAGLYHSASKFHSGCGWPSFDDEIKGQVKRQPDDDGRRVEIVCATCDGHLGHVFQGEGFTDKDTRHCVNSISLDFVPETRIARAIFAGGCFWGVEYFFQKVDGVLKVTSGYIGGAKTDPTYQEVCSGTTGHAEAVEILYDPDRVGYEDLAKLFFEIHDPTQVDRQGPDVGTQYRSAVFVENEDERRIIESLVSQLESGGLTVATRIEEASRFTAAENYHQDYYRTHGKEPYCHGYTRRF